ncbi:MAG: FAD-dependent oxidoreductase [Herminiimonas sp.]|nr:FAD-dependent oxidoreductase [Herminiimonas sp.]
MHIAIIGAGLAGLTCARQLQAQGNSVVVYEKSRAVSGRMSTRQNELGGFDHGAQYFTVASPTFKKAVTQWQKNGWVAPWTPRLVVLDHGATSAPSAAARRKQRWVAQPGMRALGVQLAQDLDIRSEQRVTRLERAGSQWLLSVASSTVAIDATAGPFDAVIVAVPADQAESLLQDVPALAAKAASARLSPCWTLMLGFDQPLGLDYDGAWVNNSRLGWIAQDASKPQRRPGEHWIAQASSAWSIEHLEDDPERAREKLLKAFHDATGTHVQPVFSAVHRWRYAQALHPLDVDCMWDKSLNLGACGDWFSAGLTGPGRIENSYLSATALATRVS